eukprot:TRINITY_DN34314_c0_g1_i1.p1 TRINITY_DN34314_c0_g1~~TRINITY_DN34314_c0_g1_i1.p1  ORF type:complete len:385 (-),score=43.76 TRINITY_DN34314_c0_g1_i1:90-1244(-)
MHLDGDVAPPRPFWCHPFAIILANLLVFGALRAIWGSSNYLPAKAWYALCFIIPVFVAAGVLIGAFCVPIQLDAPTAFHLLATLVYMQLDLLVAKILCGAEYFGSANVACLFASKLRLTPGVGDAGAPPLLRSIVEFNGALLHEIFWNVLICQNFIDWGWSVPVAIMAVPLISCAVHALTSNMVVGIRCAPQFCWVALAYHASGSVLPAGLIHAMWYMMDGKFLVTLSTFKRDWDYEDRVEESSAPLPDRPFYIGWAFILAYYAILNVFVESFPQFRSLDHHVGRCRFGRFPAHDIEWIVLGCVCFQTVVGIATWGPVRAAMDILADTGDLTTNGLIRAENAALAYRGVDEEWEEEPDLPSYQGSCLELKADAGSPLRLHASPP